MQLCMSRLPGLGAEGGSLGLGGGAGAIGNADLVELSPLAVVLELLEEVVDEVDAVGTELKADAVLVLRAERIDGKAILAGVLYDVAHVQRVVDDVGVNATLLESGAALVVLGELLDLGLGSILLYDLGTGGAGLDGDLLALEIVNGVDVLIVGGNKDGPAKEIRALRLSLMV